MKMADQRLWMGCPSNRSGIRVISFLMIPLMTTQIGQCCEQEVCPFTKKRVIEHLDSDSEVNDTMLPAKRIHFRCKCWASQEKEIFNRIFEKYLTEKMPPAKDIVP